MKHLLLIITTLLFFIIICFVYPYYTNSNREGMTTTEFDDYLQSFKQKENRMFPFRYFTDENDRVLPFVAVTGFFRSKDAEDKYNEYVQNGINIFGITAYKSFPNRELMDSTEGEYERNDTFEYIGKIREWLCCVKSAEESSSQQKNQKPRVLNQQKKMDSPNSID